MDVIFKKIKSIRQVIGSVPVYDLQVRKNTNFLCNGVVIHNCYQEQLMQFLHFVGDVPMPFTNKVRKVVTIPPDKRKPEHAKIIEKAHGQYMTGATKRGMTPELAEKWWNTIVGQAGYSFNKCLAAGTFIKTVLGEWLPIESIQPGTMVWSVNEQTGEWFPNRVIARHDNGKREVWRYTFGESSVVWRYISGESIVCTPDHKFLVGNRFIPVKDIVGTFRRVTRTVGDAPSSLDMCRTHPFLNAMEKVAVEVDTYDLETEGFDDKTGHNFIANGFVVSNSHCAAYSIITFRELFLKARFKVEFYAALLKHAKDKKLPQFVMSARRAGVVVEPPDVNRSEADVTITPEGTILLGLNALKRVGTNAIKDVIERRPYSSFQDFFEKHTSGSKATIQDTSTLEPEDSLELENDPDGLDMSRGADLMDELTLEDNKQDVVEAPPEPVVRRKNNCYKPAILSLIYGNAFRGLEASRARLLANFYGLRNAKVSPKQREPIPPTDVISLLRAEKEAVGFVFSDHELCQVPPNAAVTPLEDTAVLPEQSEYLFFGIITDISKKKSGSGRAYWVVKVSNFRHEQHFYCWKSVIGELKAQVIERERREVRPAAKVGDGIIFWARRTERSFWNMVKVRTTIPSLAEYYEQHPSVLAREPEAVLR